MCCGLTDCRQPITDTKRLQEELPYGRCGTTGVTGVYSHTAVSRGNCDYMMGYISVNGRVTDHLQAFPRLGRQSTVILIYGLNEFKTDCSHGMYSSSNSAAIQRSDLSLIQDGVQSCGIVAASREATAGWSQQRACRHVSVFEYQCPGQTAKKSITTPPVNL